MQVLRGDNHPEAEGVSHQGNRSLCRRWYGPCVADRGKTYVVRHAKDLEWITPGEMVDVGYVIEGGRRVVTAIELEDPQLREACDMTLQTRENDEGVDGGKYDPPDQLAENDPSSV